MGFASLVLSSLFSIRRAIGSITDCKIVYFVLAVILYVIVLVFAYLAYDLKAYRRDPNQRRSETNTLTSPIISLEGRF